MTVKLSELRVRADFDAGAYKAGMDQKVAADAAGAASSAKLAGAMGQSYVKVSQSGSVLERLSRTYVEGFAATEKFDRAIRTLGRGVESGAVPLARVDSILDGVYRKFGMTADAAHLASSGYTSLAQSVANLNAKLEAQGRIAPAAGGAQQLAAFIRANDARLNAGAGGTSAARGADIEAYGKSLDDLRAKYSPLYAVERQYKQTVDEVTRAHQVGALSQHEMAVAIGQAEASFRTQSQVIGLNNKVLLQHQHNAALSSYAMSNLAFQVNDVATMAAMGMSPVKILASQAGQFYQILAMGEGGVRGSLSYLGTVIGNMITPFRVVTAGALSFVAAGALAGSSWSKAQREITLGLTGMGAASGMTAADINAMSAAVAATGAATVGSARQAALALAATGRIGSDIAGQSLAITKQIALVYGEDFTQASERMGAALADPIKGVDDLNKRLLAFDAATVQQIKNLADQGRYYEADKLLINGVATATEAAAKQTGVWASAWATLSSKTSEYWAGAGRNVSLAFGGGSLDDRLAAEQANLRRLQSAGGINVRGFTFDDGAIDASKRKIADLQSELQKVTNESIRAGAAFKSLDLSKAIDEASPKLREMTAALNSYERLRRGYADGPAWSGLPAEQKADQDRTLARAKERADIAKAVYEGEKSIGDVLQKNNAFALEGITARTAAQKADLAYRKTLYDESQKTTPELAEIAAQGARMQVLRGEHERVRESIVQRNFASAQAVELAQFELTIVGKTADEAARLRAEFQARQQVTGQAFNEHRSVQPGEMDAALSKAGQLANLQSQLRASQFALDNQFERSQLFRSSSEQEVYSRLNSAGLLANGQIASAAAEAEAAYIRMTIREREAIDGAREFGTTLIKDLVAGKSAADALANALIRVADRMLDSSLDSLFSGLFGGKGGSFGIPSTGGWSTTVTPAGGGGLSSLFAGIFHAGGVAGNDNAPQRAVPAALFASAPRYHTGGVAGYRPNLSADEIPAILQRGEVVLPKSYGSAKGSDAPVIVNVTNTIDARGADSSNVVNLERILAEQQAGMKQMVIEAVRDARERRLA